MVFAALYTRGLGRSLRPRLTEVVIPHLGRIGNSKISDRGRRACNYGGQGAALVLGQSPAVARLLQHTTDQDDSLHLLVADALRGSAREQSVSIIAEQDRAQPSRQAEALRADPQD